MTNTSDHHVGIFHNVALDSANRSKQESTAMQSLWRAVITQALIDAGNNCKKKISKIKKRKAIQWLLENSEDFVTVCMLGDFNPEYVKAKAIFAMSQGCKWRDDKRKAHPIKSELLMKGRKSIW